MSTPTKATSKDDNSITVVKEDLDHPITPQQFHTPKTSVARKECPKETSLQDAVIPATGASVALNCYIPSTDMMVHDSPEASTSSLLVMPPPPPIRSVSSSSWFSDYDDPFDVPGVPAIKLLLPSPTNAQTPEHSLKQQIPKERLEIGNAEVGNVKDRANLEADPPETFYPRSIDVICGRLPQRDLSKHPGTTYYRSLVDEYGTKLVNEAKSNIMCPRGELASLKREYSTQVVKMIRARGARFLFKKKADEKQFYDIGDPSAIRKTSRLLQKCIQASASTTAQQRKSAPPSPEFETFARSISKEFHDHKKCGDKDLEDVFQLLTIPGGYDSHKLVIALGDEENCPPLLEDAKRPPLLSVDPPFGPIIAKCDKTSLLPVKSPRDSIVTTSLPTHRSLSPQFFHPLALHLPTTSCQQETHAENHGNLTAKENSPQHYKKNEEVSKAGVLETLTR